MFVACTCVCLPVTKVTKYNDGCNVVSSTDIDLKLDVAVAELFINSSLKFRL